MEQLDGVDGEAPSTSWIKFLRERGGFKGEVVGPSRGFSSAPCQYDPHGRMSRPKMIDWVRSRAKGHAHDLTPRPSTSQGRG